MRTNADPTINVNTPSGLMLRAEDLIFVVSGSKLMEPYFGFSQHCRKLCPTISPLGDKGIEALAFLGGENLVLLRLCYIGCLYLGNPALYRGSL